MNTTTKDICLTRLQKYCEKYGPITWATARLVMFRGTYDYRDASFHNARIQQWIKEGELKLLELEDGDSLVSSH